MTVGAALWTPEWAGRGGASNWHLALNMLCGASMHAPAPYMCVHSFWILCLCCLASLLCNLINSRWWSVSMRPCSPFNPTPPSSASPQLSHLLGTGSNLPLQTRLAPSMAAGPHHPASDLPRQAQALLHPRACAAEVLYGCSAVCTACGIHQISSHADTRLSQCAQPAGSTPSHCTCMSTLSCTISVACLFTCPIFTNSRCTE